MEILERNQWHFEIGYFVDRNSCWITKIWLLWWTGGKTNALIQYWQSAALWDWLFCGQKMLNYEDLIIAVNRWQNQCLIKYLQYLEYTLKIHEILFLLQELQLSESKWCVKKIMKWLILRWHLLYVVNYGQTNVNLLISFGADSWKF